MKNLFVIPTMGMSTLYKRNDWGSYHIGSFDFCEEGDELRTNQYVYVTNNEYIGLSWYLDGDLVRKGVIDDEDYWSVRKDYKKIVLTNDPKLIEDGVQPIIDNYLEWFVENPTCEEVEVIKEYFWEDTFRGYSLRLPKQGTVEEEPKCSCKVGEPYNNTCCKVHGKLNDDFENALSSFKTSLNKKYDNSVLTIQLTKEEARGLLTCIMRTSAKGKDLDVGEMVEEQLVKFLNLK
jgi:hypothetical protein